MCISFSLVILSGDEWEIALPFLLVYLIIMVEIKLLSFVKKY